MGTITFAWTSDRVEKLKAMSVAGRSFRDIAAEFGVSRNSIAGKVSRMGMAAPTRPPAPWGSNEIIELRDHHHQGLSNKAIAEAMKRSRYSIKNKMADLGLKPNRPTYERRPRRTFGRNLNELVAAALAHRPVPIDDAAIPIKQRKSLMELTEKSCRWPCGEVDKPGFFFCGGESVPGLPYCAGHSVRAYIPYERRQNMHGWRDLKW